MKKNMMFIPYLSIFLIGCQVAEIPTVQIIQDVIPEQSTQAPEQPAQPVPEPQEPVHEDTDVSPEEEYVYTLLGTWVREFDGHTEEYIFTEDILVTYCDGYENGRYNIYIDMVYWELTLLDHGIVMEFELLHSEDLDVLVLGGYQYVKR